MNFPKPEIQKQLKSFLGLANYFRTHVHNHSEIVRPWRVCYVIIIKIGS